MGNERQTNSEAKLRSITYALFSQLTASPYEAASAVLVLPPADMPTVLDELQQALPYPVDFSALIEVAQRLSSTDAESLRQDYASLFEVGSDGPPLPIRAELARGRSPERKEELVRFYEFFGYKLQPSWQWAPDHLSVLLEFMHFLTYQESQLSEADDIASYRTAQRDFLERHILDWYDQIPRGMSNLTLEISPISSTYYQTLFETLGKFLHLDFAWQQKNLGGSLRSSVDESSLITGY